MRIDSTLPFTPSRTQTRATSQLRRELVTYSQVEGSLTSIGHMKQVALAPPLVSTLNVASDEFQKNRDDMLEQLEVIDDLLDQAEAGGGQAAMDRMRSRDKLPVRERIAAVLDPGLPLSRDLRAGRLRLGLRHGRRHGRRHRRHRRHRVPDHGQRPLGARRRPHALLGQEVDARARDRARQPDPLRQLRRVGGSRPARGQRRRGSNANRPLRRERTILLRPHRTLQDARAHRQRGLWLLNGGRRLPARSLRLQHPGQGPVQDLPRRTPAREDGDRRRVRRRDPGRSA